MRGDAQRQVRRSPSWRAWHVPPPAGWPRITRSLQVAILGTRDPALVEQRVKEAQVFRSTGTALLSAHRVLALSLVLVLTLLFAACGGSDAEGGTNGDDGGGSDSGPTSADVAARLYVERGCAECHGDDGDGDGTNPRTAITGTRLIYSQFETRIRNGRGSATPAMSSDQITDEEIRTLYDWLRE
jgi:cytochrome c553